MKTTQRFLTATVLTAVLAVSTFAGDMPTPSFAPPPPPAQGGREASSQTEDPSSGETIDAYDLITEATLFFYKNVLSVL